jgi:hypothetical protein
VDVPQHHQLSAQLAIFFPEFTFAEFDRKLYVAALDFLRLPARSLAHPGLNATSQGVVRTKLARGQNNLCQWTPHTPWAQIFTDKLAFVSVAVLTIKKHTERQQ